MKWVRAQFFSFIFLSRYYSISIWNWVSISKLSINFNSLPKLINPLHNERNQIVHLFWIGIRSVLFDALVWTQFKRRPWTSTSVFRYRWNFSILTVSGSCEIPLGRHWRWQEREPRFWTVYGCWCFNDYDWRRVSVSYAICTMNLAPQFRFNISNLCIAFTAAAKPFGWMRICDMEKLTAAPHSIIRHCVNRATLKFEF